MNKLFIENMEIKGKKVLMRVDFNVPLDGDRNVLDATRIESTIPSIQYVLDQGGALILMSHLGRPKYAFNPDLSLAPVAIVLSNILNRPVAMAPDCIGSHVSQMADRLKMGEVLLLENLRFHRAEEHPDEDPTFAKELASFGDLYVNDAFACSHRKHASIYSVPMLFEGKAAAGYLLEKEIRFLNGMLDQPKKPFYALLGGSKISTKMGVIQALLKKCDKILIGGAMAYTFFKAQGYKVGLSPVEEDFLPMAENLLKKNILLPDDVICATDMSEDADTKLVDIREGIPEGYLGLDIGPKTIEKFSTELNQAQTIMWNGPFGVYELERFAKGTRTLAKHIESLSATSVIGGGDLVAAIKAMGDLDKFSHVSTGGGSTLEFIEFGTLPGIDALSEANRRH